jgi:hypothetical protein
MIAAAPGRLFSVHERAPYLAQPSGAGVMAKNER